MSPIGIDIGGTFTDFVHMTPQGIRIEKILSSYPDPRPTVLEGLSRLDPSALEQVVHGSTVATNALLEEKGTPTALITTRGFADVLEIGRQNRPSLYDLFVERPRPLVSRDLRFEIDERIAADGSVLKGVEPAEVDEVLERIVAAGVTGVAICFLFSFLQPSHEREVARRARERGLWVTASVDILPEHREYERTSTTVINAYLHEIMDGHLGQLERAMEPRPVRIMQSNGGTASVAAVKTHALTMLLSGPAAGVVAARHIADEAGRDRIIAFDMGGTSTDVCLADRQYPLTTESEVGGRPFRLPACDIHTVGAGGGSMAWVDEAGALRVGPESAGSSPGPVCYGLGETITVSDANLVLGRLHPESFLGGRMSIDHGRALSFMEALAARLGRDAVETAAAIAAVANANMVRAIKKVSVERGHEPQDFTLVAFGGAGPLHACDLARELEMGEVLIPPSPGVLSALGLLVADVVKDFSQGVLERVGPGTLASIAPRLSALEEKAAAAFTEEDLPTGNILFQRRLDLRYLGQSYELTIDLDPGQLYTDEGLASVRSAFEEAHERRFGYRRQGRPLELVALRLRASLPSPALAAANETKPVEPATSVSGPPASGALSARKPIFFDSHGWLESDVWTRGGLAPGNTLSGPALVVQDDTTFVLPPDFSATVDARGNLIGSRNGS